MPDIATMTLESPADIVTKVMVAEEINFTPGERSMVAWITTDHVDLEGDVVVAEGVDWAGYIEKNPIVCAFHDLGRWPIGQCKWIKLKRGNGFTGLSAKNDFDDDPDSDLVWRKVKRRTVRSVSIGFMPPPEPKPGDWGPPTREEIQRRPDWAKAKRIIRRCVLKEYSICPIGMNPNALATAVNKGLQRPIYHDSQEAPTMPDATGAALPGGAPETKAATPDTKCPDGSCGGKCPEGKDMADGDGDETMALKPGTHVMCKGAGCGTVKSLHTEGEHAGPGGGMIAATKAAPVGEVDMHDDDHGPTGEVKAFAFADLAPHDGAKAMAEGSGTSGGYAVKPDDEADPEESEPDDDDDGDDDLDEGENDDEAKGFKAGDHVKVKAAHYKGFGVVKGTYRKGHVPNVPEDIKATEGEPAARVQAYKRFGDGHVPTADHVGVKVKDLMPLPEPMTGPSKPAKSAPAAPARKAAKGTPVAVDPLPPLVALSDEELQRQRAAEIKRIPEYVHDAIYRLVGGI